MTAVVFLVSVITGPFLVFWLALWFGWGAENNEWEREVRRELAEDIAKVVALATVLFLWMYLVAISAEWVRNDWH